MPLRPVVPCPHCGGEVTVQGVQGETLALTAEMPWELVVEPQLAGLAAEVLAAEGDSLLNVSLRCGPRAVAAEVAPVTFHDPGHAAYVVARQVAASWPGFLTDAEVGYIAHVGAHTFTAGATLMDALAAPGGLDEATWLGSVLVEVIDLGPDWPPR